VNLFVVSAVAAPLLVPTLGAAQQDQIPTRLGNIWGGDDHEPVPGEVLQREDAAGLLGSASQQRARDDEVEQLARELMRRAQGGDDGVMRGSAPIAPQR